MPIINERIFIKMNRLAGRQNFSNDEEKMKFFESFAGDKVPDISGNELTTEERAEDLAFDVLESIETGNDNMDWEKMEQLFEKSREALALCPDCLLAMEAASKTAPFTKSRDRYILKGVELGEKKFGGSYEIENEGNFWGVTETRPYMRLLSMKAEWLIAQGKRHNAMELYEKLLRLHPDDAIGARLPLQVLYLEFKEYDKFIELQERFSDGFSVHHHYNYALYLYMVQAGEDELDEAMDEAIEFNPYVLPYLQGKKKIKDQYLTRYNPKDESGATVYCVDALYLWHQQYGIQKWLKKFS